MSESLLDKMGVTAVGVGNSHEDVLRIEILGLYDGWSVLQLRDGTLINRWPEEDYRYKATQEWIDSYKKSNNVQD